MPVCRWPLLAASLLVGASTFGQGAAAQELNLYTTREAGLIKPLTDEFTKQTGIKVNTVFMEKGMPERVASEGTSSPADILMAVDAGSLVELVEKGVTQKIGSETVDKAVPANLRDADGHWTALSMRARVVYAGKDRVSQQAITYEELADPKWKGKICIRSGQHPYNTALTAHFISKHGEAKTEEWLRGVRANLARKPAGGDRENARDILGSLCDLGVGNTYYVGLMRSGKGGPDQQKWGGAINVILASFANGGTHVNVSGAAIAKHSPNKPNAVKFLEYLLSDAGQRIYAEQNYEYPVKAGVGADPIIAGLGQLKIDTLSLGEWSKHRRAASQLIDKVAFDN